MFAAILIAIACLFATTTYAWREAREIRLPGELRIVNEGLAHDDTNWFLSNQHVLYKTTIEPMEIVAANYHAIPQELSQRRYNHIGDIDVIDGIIYGGLESSNEPQGILAAWNATDLSLIRYKETTMKGMPWVAIDPKTRLLYSAVWNDCCKLQVYDLVTFDFVGTVATTNPEGLPREIQGGAFYENDLYLAVNGNCSIYKMDINTGHIDFVLSDSMNHHDYEMEGLTFWDLRKQGYGVMHMYGNFMTIREKGIRSYSP